MKNVFKFLGIIAVVAVIVFSMAACKEVEDKGPLAVTKWVRTAKNPNDYDWTFTYSFNDSSKGRYTVTGRWYSNSTKKWTNYNGEMDFSFTYIYVEKDKLGSIEANDGIARGFTIDGNKMKVTAAKKDGSSGGSSTYTRQ